MVDEEKDTTKLVCIKKQEAFKFNPESFPKKVEKYEESEEHVAIVFEEEQTLDYILDDLSREGYDIKAFGNVVENYFD